MRTIVVLLVSALLAGCTADSGGVTGGLLDSGETQPNVGSATLQPGASTEGVPTASVGGRITDSELRPIPNASVTLVEHQLTLLTTQDGSFRFEEIPVGRKILEAQALGFQAVAKALDLTADGAESIMIALEPLDVRDTPFHISLERRFSIELGNPRIPRNQDTCSQCSANISFPPLPDSWIVETTWTTSSNPVLNHNVRVGYTFPFVDAQGYGWKTRYDTYANREKRDYGVFGGGAYLNWLRSASTYFAMMNVTGGGGPAHVSATADGVHLNWDHKFSVWTTFGYVEKLPADFTALPKD